VAFCTNHAEEETMKNLSMWLVPAALMAAGVALSGSSPRASVLQYAVANGEANASAPHYVVTNDDLDGPNTASIYLAAGPAAAARLILVKTIPTGGTGSGGDGAYFASVQQVLVAVNGEECIFVSDSQSSDIAGIRAQTLTVTGNFKGSSTDQGTPNIGLETHGNYLYAAFGSSQTIATFTMGAGCTLSFVADVPAVGLGQRQGSVDGMVARGNLLVVAYGDGSIGSFSISGGVPVANGDEQLSTGYRNHGSTPGGVDITRDGHFALFGDAPSSTEVEVSDLSSGKLAATVDYGPGILGPGSGSNNILLGPEEGYVYVSNNYGGQVTAVRFDAATGVVSPFADGGCISPVLKNFNNPWATTGALATAGPEDHRGVVLWVAEYGIGHPSSIGIVRRTTNGGQCTLTESAASPASDAHTGFLVSLAAYPSRGF
jgi:Lactonase, 7-bladed beta-propeller